MTPVRTESRQGRWVEYAFLLAIVVLLARVAWWFSQYGHLPQPFFYEPSDTYMDWFNTAYWSHDNGTYDTWRTIYPPLSFVVLRYLGIARCYTGNEGLTVRDCDWVGLVAIHAIFVMNLVLVALTFRKVDRATALPRTVALALGMPMLFALERGNILLLCFTCMVLAFGPLLRSARLRWLFAGLAINFKVYLIGAVAALLLRRRWLWTEGALVASILVYVASYAALGTGNPMEIVRNITAYSEGFAASQVLDIWYSVTYLPLVSLLEGSNFPVTSVIGSEIVDAGLLVIPVLMRLGQVAIVLAAVATWLRPEVVPPYRVVLFGTAMALISSEAGGYTQILAILLVFMERWRGFGRPLAIVCCYILCLPADLVIGDVPPLIRDSYLAGRPVEVNFGVGLGMFLRPGLLIVVAMALSAVTIRDVWKDIRLQGWHGRWRYRQDAPLLPLVERPEPAGGARP